MKFSSKRLLNWINHLKTNSNFLIDWIIPNSMIEWSITVITSNRETDNNNITIQPIIQPGKKNWCINKSFCILFVIQIICRSFFFFIHFLFVQQTDCSLYFTLHTLTVYKFQTLHKQSTEEKNSVCLKSYPVHFDFLSFICLYWDKTIYTLDGIESGFRK